MGNKNSTQEPARDPNATVANGVIITMYVESTSRPVNKQLKQTSVSSEPLTARSGGHDRRAELLAYSHELRRSFSQQPVHYVNPGPRTKKWRWILSLRKLRLSFGRVLERTTRKIAGRYENIRTEDQEKHYRSCPLRRNYNRNKTKKKLCNVFKDCSRGMTCSK